MDGFIDYITTITIENPCWVERAKNLALLIIHTIFIPRNSYKPLKQDDPLSLHKIAGEGQIVERKTCLGWYTHTRSLRVFLPREKETSRLQDIRASLAFDENKYRQARIPHWQA